MARPTSTTQSRPDATGLETRARRLKLRHLRLMLILNDERSITRAAERLFISPAAVSKTRAELEAEIGGALFERTGNGLELTELGDCVLQSSKRVLAELESLDEEMNLMRSGMKGTVNIGIRSIAAQPFIARVTAAFNDRFPDLTVRLIDADLPSLRERLARADISLLVARVGASDPLKGMQSRVILADPNVVMVSPGHPLASRSRVEWSELIQQRWCLTPTGFAGPLSAEHLQAYLADQNLPFPTHVVETNSMLMIMTLFQSGNYLSLVPQTVGDDFERRGIARFVKLPPVGPTDPVRIMWRAGITLPPAARRFRELLIEMLDAEAAGAGASRNSPTRRSAAGNSQSRKSR
jgi:DNA-binding transcriptional LysR family regulator